MFDVLVIGAGMGGMATAALAQRLGLRTGLLEAHTKLGGCAGYFQRGPYTFDAGATALMGLRPGEPLHDVLNLLDVNFQAVETSSYRVHLPDRQVDIVPEADTFEKLSSQQIPGDAGSRSALAQRRFWRLQAAVGNALWRASTRIPRLPLRSIADAIHDLRVLGFAGLLAASTSALTVQHVLRLLDLERDVSFR